MYVCVCNGVTEQDIRCAMDAGCSSMSELTMRTGCGATCGCCVDTACRMLDKAASAKSQALAVLPGNVVMFPLVPRAA